MKRCASTWGGRGRGRGLEQGGSQTRAQVLGPPAAARQFPEEERVLEGAGVGIRGAPTLVPAARTGLQKAVGGAEWEGRGESEGLASLRKGSGLRMGRGEGCSDGPTGPEQEALSCSLTSLLGERGSPARRQSPAPTKAWPPAPDAGGSRPWALPLSALGCCFGNW